MTGTRAKKLRQISWSTSSTRYPRIDTRIDMKTTQGKPVLLPPIKINITLILNYIGTSWDEYPKLI